MPLCHYFFLLKYNQVAYWILMIFKIKFQTIYENQRESVFFTHIDMKVHRHIFTYASHCRKKKAGLIDFIFKNMLLQNSCDNIYLSNFELHSYSQNCQNLLQCCWYSYHLCIPFRLYFQPCFLLNFPNNPQESSQILRKFIFQY